MTNRELEKKYNEMKITYHSLIDANVELQDENKEIKKQMKDLVEIVRDKFGQDLSNLKGILPEEILKGEDKE